MGIMFKLCVTAAAGLALGVAIQAAEPKGKEIYQKTCQQCHGPNGHGDRSADKFYQVTIPRLSSDYAQNKSDDEIREIITTGRRKMVPVRMGQPQALHSLAEAQVTDVIAYVRTLKKR